MKKRKVLLTALFICFALSLQEMKAAETHKLNEDITGGSYTNYQNSDGGVLETQSTHTSNVTDATFQNNTATSSGGAIYNAGTVNVQGSTFEGNNADGGYNKQGYGGAIYNEGILNVENSAFTNNNAGKSDQVWQEEGHGGAVYNSKNAEITNSIFEGNHAKYGGAIHNEANAEMSVGGEFKTNTAETGGAINNSGTLTVKSGSKFENNDATRFDGGAINNAGGTLNIEDNVTFKNNNAYNKEDDYMTPRGGAIFSESLDGPNGEVHIGNGVTFEGNKAEEGGAIGIYKNNTVTIQDNAVFKDNKATTDGGAISMFTIDSPDLPAANFEIGNNALFEGNVAGYSDWEEVAVPSVVFGGAVSITDAMMDESRYSSFTIGDGATFRNNKAGLGSGVYGYGGALYNAAYHTTVGDNALFENNFSDYGGAVYNQANLVMGNNAVFKSNTSSLFGGAIFNSGGSLTLGDNATFDSNSASYGGALYNAGTKENTIQKATFKNNTASYGGALYNDIYNTYEGAQDSKLTVKNSEFIGNSAKSDSNANYGGAVYNQSFVNILDTLFENNTALDGGGAIYSTNSNEKSETPNLKIENSQFTNNGAGYGGAIASSGADAAAEIINSYFNSNYAALTKTKEASSYNGQGGAIWYGSSSASDLVVKGSTFENNTAETGGAIATYKAVTVTDTNFVNNKADDKGGAIWANGDVTVNASEKDVVFAGNSAKDGADIYMDNSSADKAGSLNLKADKDRNITLTGGISGAQEYEASLDGEGTVTFNSEIKNAKMEVTNGTLHLAQGSSLTGSTTVNVKDATLDTQDGAINDYSEKVFIGDNSRLKFDLSSANKTTDKFSAVEGLQSGTVKVEDFNFIPDTKVSNGVMTAADIKGALGLGDAVTLELPEKSFKALTPLRYVNVQSGQNGISYTPTGNSFNDFNPSVMISSVAAQLGGYLTQLDSYDEAFRNMDMYMIMPKSMRMSMKNRNKYALEEKNAKIEYDKSAAQYDNTSVWARPYATFENVGLKGGPRVSNVAWGTYLGGDSELFELHNGWEGMWGAYVGYNGSHQAYNGVSIYQNGGTIGLTGALYKNNFFTGLTANIGANAADFSSNYGDDSFALLRTGIASKTGYNFEFADGKFIIQPSWTMSYSFINTGDYTTSGGIRVSSDPLNAMHIEPGLKFIGNGKDGWQPYAGLSIVWNFLDKTDFTASDATLPELSVKPFFKYGVGLRKLYGERFIGYGQVYVTNGGRNGVGLQFGGRWTL